MFTGREEASRKFVWRVLLTISEWTGRKSGREHDREDILDEVVEDVAKFETENLKDVSEKSDIVRYVVPGTTEQELIWLVPMRGGGGETWKEQDYLDWALPCIITHGPV